MEVLALIPTMKDYIQFGSEERTMKKLNIWLIVLCIDR